MPYHIASRGFFANRSLALTIAFAVVTLVVSQLASAGESSLDAVCQNGVIASETSENDDVRYDGNGVRLWASARSLTLRADVQVVGGPPLRYCDVTTTFQNSVLIEPGTSGLAPGDPVTLGLTVALDGELATAWDGSRPESGPASFTASSRATAWVAVTAPERPVCVPDDGGEYCTPAKIGRFDAEAQQKADGSEPTATKPNGFFDFTRKWSWKLQGNRGDDLGDDADAAYSCDWPGPCVIGEPIPTPDYRGTRTILVDAIVGDRLQLDGFLHVLPGVGRGIASARFPTGDTSGLRASLVPGNGFEGLELEWELTPPEEPPPPPPPPPPPGVSVSIGDASVVEGQAGTKAVFLPVRLSEPSAAAVSVPYTTRNGTATSDEDYEPTFGTVSFPAGEVERTIGVEVIGDRVPEPDEVFEVTLGEPAGATLGDGVGQATIEDDEDDCILELTFDFVEARGCFVPDGDVYRSEGDVQVNGLDLATKDGTPIRIDRDQRRIFSGPYNEVEVRAGDVLVATKPIDWRVPRASAKTEIVVESLPVPATIPPRTLRGLPIVASIPLSFTRTVEARLVVPVGIPFLPIKIGETTLRGEATLVTDNEQGLRGDSMKVTAEHLPVPPVTVRSLSLGWDTAHGRWEGEATVVIPTPEALAVTAGFAFENGAFAGAKAAVDNLNVHVGNGIYVQAIRFSVAFDPLQLAGGIGLSAGPVVAGKTALRLDGDFGITFGDPLVVGATGTLKLIDWKVAAAYFRYFSSGSIEFGGGVAIGLPDPSEPRKQPVSLITEIDGWVDGAVGFAAHGSADVVVLGLPLVGAEALVSNIGAAACGRIAWLRAGFGYRWDTSELAIMGPGTCNVGPYEPVRPSPSLGSAAEPASTQFQLPASADGVVLRLHGAAAAPKVRLTGPGGRVVTTPAEPGTPLANDEFVVMQDEQSKTTIIAIRRPAGTWTLSTVAGWSDDLTGIELAGILPPPSVSAAVRGDSHQPRLTWRVRSRPGQSVTLVEEAEGVAHVIARSTAAAGSVQFIPADGPEGRRDIVAIVEQDGLPGSRQLVASYEAPDPDDDLPGDVLARRRLGELNRVVRAAQIAPAIRRELVSSLRDARRALRPPAPDAGRACVRVGDFVVAVQRAIGPAPGIPEAEATRWIKAAEDVRRLLACS